MLKVFRSLHKFPDCYSSWMQDPTKDILTTKITKATKVLSIFGYELRALRALRGQIRFSRLALLIAVRTRS